MKNTMNSLLKLTDVCVFRGENYILDNLNWEVSRPQNWAVLGPNGSGKSFLLSLLYLNTYPSTGRFQIMNETLGQTNIWNLKQHIGYASNSLQVNYRVNAGLRQVIGSGFFSSNGLHTPLTREMHSRVSQIIESLKIGYLNDRAFGLLSEGEKRRALIGRALVFDPRILLLDEPCNGLDIASREDFLQVIQGLCDQGRTIIYVTHYTDEIVPGISHVLCLKEGKEFSSGKKSDVLSGENISRLFDYPLNVIHRNGRYESRMAGDR